MANTDPIMQPTNMKPKPRIVVRLRTEYYTTERGVFRKTCLLYLKSKSTLHNFFAEDAEQSGPEYVIPKITNLADCPDGVYEIVWINIFRDWETGHVEDWDYKLVPYTE